MALLKNIVLFAVEFLFDLYILLLLLRIMLTLAGANFYNPISHFILNFTRLFIKPLQRLFPVYKKIDFAAIVVLIVFELIKILLLIWLRFDNLPSFLGLVPWAVGEILNQIINILFYALLLRAILSWIGTTVENPFFQVLHTLTEPLLQPFRRFIPLLAGFDISAVILAFLLKGVAIFLVVPLVRWGELSALSKFFNY